MSEALAWAVYADEFGDGVPVISADEESASRLAHKCSGTVVPLFAAAKKFVPANESNLGLIEAIQVFIDQTDPWKSQVADAKHKVHSIEHGNARRALCELKKRLLALL